MKSAERHLAGAHLLAQRQTSVPEPMSLAAELAVQHRPAGDDDRRQIAARRAHQQRRRGLVAAAQQHDAVDRIGADRLLDVHAGEVAEQHRGRPHLRLAERHHRELEREAARLADAALHVLGDARGNARCTASARTRCCRCRSPAGRRRHARGRPWFFIQLRWMKPSRSAWPNQWLLRRRLLSGVVRHRCLPMTLSRVDGGTDSLSNVPPLRLPHLTKAARPSTRRGARE